MNQKILAAVFACVLITTAQVNFTYAWGPPHDAPNGIFCNDCHNHQFGFMPRGEVQEEMCKTCHNPQGRASNMSDVANHVVNGGELIIDCGSCHIPHEQVNSIDPHPGGQEAPNLSQIRWDTSKYYEPALEPAVFQERPDHFAFAENDAPWNGICQTCHTETSHHTNSAASDHTHFTGFDCTMCHTHESGFQPQGGCLECHSSTKGERRQITGDGGDFSKQSHHVHGDNVTESDCVACHYTGSHGSGTVKLLNVDTDEVITYDPGNPAGLEEFCTSCHDDDGAAGQNGKGIFPFSDSLEVPDIKYAWTNSAHRTIGYPFNQGNPVSCFGDGSTTGCHGNAHGSDNIKLLSAAPTVSIHDFCYNCHTNGKIMNLALSGAELADDIQQAFSLSQRHIMGYGFNVSGRSYTLECTTCHNPHVVTGKHWDADLGVSPITRPDLNADPQNNPRATGSSLWGAAHGQKMADCAAKTSGTGGWKFNVSRGYVPGASGLPADQPGVYVPMRITRPWLSSTGSSPKKSDSPEFNYTLSGTVMDGDVEQEFEGTILPDYVTLCMDCHSRTMGFVAALNWNDNHGFGNAQRPYAYPCQSGSKCENRGANDNQDPLFENFERGRGSTHFMRFPYDSAERNSGINFVLSCTDCHEAHGSSVSSFLRSKVNGGPGTIIWNEMCNNCHYYYGAQHSGMSCGNASCHEFNSIHRMKKKGESSGGTFIYDPPDDINWSVVYEDSSSPAGVIGLWHLDGNGMDASLNNNSVLRARDKNGVNPGDLWSQGKFGQALKLDGVTALQTNVAKSHNMRTDQNDPETAAHMSVDAWIYPEAADYNMSILGHGGFSSVHWRFELNHRTQWGATPPTPCPDINQYTTAGRLVLFISVYDKTLSTTDQWRSGYSTVDVPLNEWSYVTATFDKDRSIPVQVYINGEEVTDRTNTNPNTNLRQPQVGWTINTTRSALENQSWWKPEYIYYHGMMFGMWGNIDLNDPNLPAIPNPDHNTGGKCYTWPNPFVGKIDDARIMNITLADEQIYTRYVNGLQGIPATDDINK